MRIEMPEKRKKYDREFREGAVRIVEETNRPIAQVARDLGVPYWTLRKWYTNAEMTKRKPPQTTSTETPLQETDKEKIARLERELKKLHKENDSLRMDREILKKATAFFAKESE